MTAFTFTTCARPQGDWAILANGKVMPLICATQEQAQALILKVIDYHVRRAKATSSGMINAARLTDRHDLEAAKTRAS